jgi:2,4-dienoyl-CoA reductase-like NADH-dependent reductase (Old Yellow Enzyme family)
MRYFTYRSLPELQQAAGQLGCRHVRFVADPGRVRDVLARPVVAGRLRLGNAMAIHPMEGCDGTLDGRPGELTWRRYERFATGGAKLIWFEATAIREDARANPRQVWLNPNTRDDFARLVERILTLHREAHGTTGDLIMPVQLTVSGRYAWARKTIAYHNPLIDAKTNTPADYPVVTDDELERIEDDYVAASGLALEAGFTAVDVKATHGYLFSELLGAKTRPGRYGGALENRARIIRNIIGKLRARYGARLMICMRLGCFDGVPYKKNEATGCGEPYPYPVPYPWGFGVDANDPLREDLSEPQQLIGWLVNDGLELLNVSIGCPYYNPHIGRPFEKPDEGNYAQPEHPLLGVERHFRIAAALQRAYPQLPMVGTGYSWLQKYALNAAAANLESGAISIFGLGRGVLSYPDFARDALAAGELDERRVCKTLTYCSFLMRQKTNELGQYPAGCPPFDKEVYGPIMKEARERNRRQG